MLIRISYIEILLYFKTYLDEELELVQASLLKLTMENREKTEK